MTNKSCKCLKDVLQMLFANSDSEGEYLRFGNDDRLSNDHASSGTSPPGMARLFKKHKQVIISALCPMEMGVAGVDVVLVSIGEAMRCWWSSQIVSFFLITHAQSAAGRQYRCSQCWVTLGLSAVRNFKLTVYYCPLFNLIAFLKKYFPI